MHRSPIGLVPKSSGGFRMIVDLSSPHGRSVDDGIDPAVGSMDLCLSGRGGDGSRDGTRHCTGQGQHS